MHERGVPQHAPDNMVKVRVADLRLVAVALLMVASASLTTGSPIHKSRPWHNPCHVSSVSGKERRHAANRSNRVLPLVTALRNTRDNLEEEWMKVQSMYEPIESLEKTFDDLPSTNDKKTIPKLHEDLQKILIGMIAMMHETDHLLIHDPRVRMNFFREVSNRAKYLLCEVETYLNTTHQTKPNLQEEYSPCENVGTAVVLGCEKTFFDLYKSFLVDWNRDIHKTVKNNSKRKGKRENRKVKDNSKGGKKKRLNKSERSLRSAV